MDRYEQRGWLRQLSVDVTPAMEDALLTTIARMDGLPFPSTVGLLGRVARGRVRRRAPAELAYCAEVVAEAYMAMGLLDDSRPSNYYDPGKFWSGDDLDLSSARRWARRSRSIGPSVPSPGEPGSLSRRPRAPPR